MRRCYTKYLLSHGGVVLDVTVQHIYYPTVGRARSYDNHLLHLLSHGGFTMTAKMNKRDKRKLNAERAKEFRQRMKDKGLRQVQGIFAPDDVELRKKIRLAAEKEIEKHLLSHGGGVNQV